jgi:hypothetical protein
MAQGANMSAEKELIVAPPQETALAVYSVPNGLDPWLQQIRVEVDAFNSTLPELTTLKGRKMYASMAHKIAQSKTLLEKVGKALSAEQKEVPKRIDAERKRVWDLLESWQAEVRKPLDDWQAAEDKRIESHIDRLEWLRGLPLNLANETSTHVQGLIDQAEAVEISDEWEEFKIEAAGAKDLAIKALRATHAELQRYEADQAELARLRAEAEAQVQRDREAEIARAAAERARIEAEQRAQAERDAVIKREADAKAAADRRELELKLAAEQAERAAAQAERERIEAEQRAAQQKIDDERRHQQALIQAESDRVAAVERAEREKAESERKQAEAAERARLAEVARQEAATREEQRLAAAREADKAHKAKINGAALRAFIDGGMPEECARQAVVLIAQRKIPNIAITY